MLEEDPQAASLRLWERRAIMGLLSTLSIVFMIWAGVVWNSSQNLVVEIRAVRSDINTDRLEQYQYRALLERRITILEQRQEYFQEFIRQELIRERGIE